MTLQDVEEQEASKNQAKDNQISRMFPNQRAGKASNSEGVAKAMNARSKSILGGKSTSLAKVLMFVAWASTSAQA